MNVVGPGPIATPIFGKTGLPEAAVKKLGGAILPQVPLARFGEVSDAAYVTGTELLVDGGMAQG